jgi:hypothetical protein
MFRISEVQESPAFNGRRSFLTLRELLSYRSGQLAKLPRCLDRFEELKNTTRIDASSLLKLPIVPKDEKEEKGTQLIDFTLRPADK